MYLISNRLIYQIPFLSVQFEWIFVYLIATTFYVKGNKVRVAI